MTDGLDVLLGWLEFGVLVGALVVILLHRARATPETGTPGTDTPETDG